MAYENKPYDNKPSDAYPSAPPPSYNATYDESAYLERIHYYLMCMTNVTYNLCYIT